MDHSDGEDDEPARRDAELLEGIDCYVENSSLVFTAAFCGARLLLRERLPSLSLSTARAFGRVGGEVTDAERIIPLLITNVR